MLKETVSGALAAKAVVGLGNPDRSDDGVGVAVVERLTGCTGAQIFTAVKTGLDLVLSLLSYDKVLVVDATPSLPPGEVALFRLTCCSNRSPSSSPSPPLGEKEKFLGVAPLLGKKGKFLGLAPSLQFKCSPLPHNLPFPCGGKGQGEGAIGSGFGLKSMTLPPLGERGKFSIAPSPPQLDSFPCGGEGQGEGEQRQGFLHGLDFVRAWSLVKDLGLKVPEIWILAIGIPAEPRFGRGLSPEVSAALPKAQKEVERWLQS